MIEALLKSGADPNAPYGDGETPLMTAARTGSVDAVKMLLTFGASVAAREAWRGETALMWAAAENHAAVVKLLVELKADVNARSVHYEFSKLTGGNGGIIHDRSEGGLTPLFFAARQGATEAAVVLIEAGAEMHALEPQYGFTPMQTAIFNGHYDFAALLVEKGADVNDGSLYTAIEMRNLAA
jgi:ankyrin repeat protein